MTTGRQKAAVKYCEYWLAIKFKGDINSFSDVSYFLGQYLEDAKETDAEAYREEQTYRWNHDQ